MWIGRQGDQPHQDEKHSSCQTHQTFLHRDSSMESVMRFRITSGSWWLSFFLYAIFWRPSAIVLNDFKARRKPLSEVEDLGK